MKPEVIFAKVWDILVEYAGCRDDPERKETFIGYFLNDKFPGHEWRFQGHLGFGGKFFRDASSYRVSCYLEDRTTYRTAVVDKVNKLLETVPFWSPPRS